MRLALLLPLTLLAQTSDKAREEQAYSIGVQAYIYGLAPNILEVTRQQVAPPANRNRFIHAASLATHQSRAVVAPNNDTLYSTAWLDLAQGPLLMHVPAISRYHTFQFLDGYTNNFAYVGTRVTGSNGGDFVIHGPGWRGKIPSGAKAIASPTNVVWIIGRILVDGPADIPNVAVLQKQLTLTPLSNPSAVVEPAPQVGRGKPVVPQVNAMNAQDYFGTLARVFTGDGQPAHSACVAFGMERIALALFKHHGFDPKRWPSGVRKVLWN